ncbi:MAG: maleylpyruvate isomerase family mycothiol-dependent enzyme [Actinobacteria bacterium]|uniref:Unannotated protein n=1 Tax=freshwater metagenome TaxID=449393 RepID=A0A6J6NEY2_9ZZZZ|nr:maleylpyruvate isomerase family mycothiol-dependent enzyme [Actinomycetota bacterium]
MALPESPAAQHAAVAGRFADLVAGVGDWDAASPVAGWTARDVVAHLLEWFPGFLQHFAGVELAPVDATDPVGSWPVRTADVQALLDAPDADGRGVDDPMLGTMTLPEAVARFYTADVFMHTWDLARASGQDDRLDADQCAVMLAGMSEMEDAMRGSGQYGPAVDVPADAPAQDRLLGFIGRDPAWRPPRGLTPS